MQETQDAEGEVLEEGEWVGSPDRLADWERENCIVRLVRSLMMSVLYSRMCVT